MNCLYTIPLCNFGFAFRHATCVIVKDFGKALLKTKSSPIFFSYKLSERKPLFEIALCIVGKWNSMFPKFCGIKSLWTIFMTGQGQSFSERTYFWRNTTLDATVWGKIWNASILVDNNVFVLQATQSINSPNLEASRLQVHFLQHVKLHVFGEDVFWRNTDF